MCLWLRRTLQTRPRVKTSMLYSENIETGTAALLLTVLQKSPDSMSGCVEAQPPE